MNKDLRFIQARACPGKCAREDIKGDVCQPGTCEFHIDDPFNQDIKAELEAKNETLPEAPVRHVVTMRPALYSPHRKRSKR